MTRSGKSGSKPLLALAVLMLIAPVALSQNLYDLDHSRQFARYLMLTRQYQLAVGEWERVLFLSPSDSAARINLVRSYRLSGDPQAAWLKLNQWNPGGALPGDLAREAIQLTLQLNDFNTFRSVLSRSPGLTEDERSDYRVGAYLIEGSWTNRKFHPDPASLLAPGTNPKLRDLLLSTEAIRYKSPAGAVALSALLPGLGKVYSDNWKDGLFSLVFVGTNVWQSYRGFSKDGIQSVTGWIFGTLAAGFYTANLFGSWKSAREYNERQIHRIRHEAENLLYTY
ncbi:MAG: hypothetical protein R6V75_09185 [Bacteroidales bacterium]